MRGEIHTDFTDEMDNRGIGGVAFLNQKALMMRMDTLEENLMTSMRSTNDVAEEFVSTSKKSGLHPAPMTITPCQHVTIRQSDSVRCSYFVSNNGSFRKLPPGYEFPTMGLTSLICMWFCGDK